MMCVQATDKPCFHLAYYIFRSSPHGVGGAGGGGGGGDGNNMLRVSGPVVRTSSSPILPLPDAASGLDWSNLVETATKAFQGTYIKTQIQYQACEEVASDSELVCGFLPGARLATKLPVTRVYLAFFSRVIGLRESCL